MKNLWSQTQSLVARLGVMLTTLTVLGLCGSRVYALDMPPAEGSENLSEKEVRDQKVKDALVGSREDQNFSLYKLNYAILNDEDLILQYSFKYRVIDELYLAYTNFILWDIYHEEMPAIDNNFMPEMFYRFNISNNWASSVDFGWFHRSNGSSGPMASTSAFTLGEFYEDCCFRGQQQPCVYQ